MQDLSFGKCCRAWDCESSAQGRQEEKNLELQDDPEQPQNELLAMTCQRDLSLLTQIFR